MVIMVLFQKSLIDIKIDFIKLYTHKDSYKEIAKFSTWLYTIAANISKSELRKIKMRKTFSVSDFPKANQESMFKSPESNLESKINSINIEKNIQSALSGLSIDFKTIIILRDIQELSYDDISKITDTPIGTVKSRINRARLKLQKLLTINGERLI